MLRSERERFFHDEVDIRSQNRKIHTRFWHVFKSPNSRRANECFTGLLRAATPGRRVLEIGCGQGNLCQKVLEMGAAEVHGSELSRHALEKARLFISSKAQRHFFAQEAGYYILVGFRHVAAFDMDCRIALVRSMQHRF